MSTKPHEPGIPREVRNSIIEAGLTLDVQRLERRLESARDDLRRWRLSHSEQPQPSAYESGVLRLSHDDTEVIDGRAARFR